MQALQPEQQQQLRAAREARVESLLEMRLNPRTRKAYSACIDLFKRWLRKFEPTYLRNNGEIDLDKLDAKVFQLFLVDQKVKANDGTFILVSTSRMQVNFALLCNISTMLQTF